MLNNIKALFFIALMGYAVFHFARPICLRFMSAEDFDRRRKVWFGITFAVFLSPNFWIFIALITPMLIWAARRDSNPIALYLFVLYASPAVALSLPVFGINRLFELSPVRLLAFCILIPLIVRHKPPANEWQQNTRFTDFCLLGYCLLLFALRLPHESFTSGMRNLFLLYLDIIVPYWAFSRTLRGRDKIVEAIACFTLSAAILAPISAFESLKGWLVYVIVGTQWGVPNEFAFLLRGGRLRAQVTAGHALSLGYLMAVGFGFWLYLHRHQLSKLTTYAVAGIMWVGLLAAYSRGPWIVAAFFFFLHLLLMPHGMSRAVKAAFSVGIAGSLLLATPLGDRIIDNLPFIGTVDHGNVVYRQRLFETSIQLIQEKPWFGDLFVMSRMEHLRQGQGIIDIVNGYLLVALFSGVVGLSLIVGFFVSATVKAYAASVRIRKIDAETSLLGANLVACMVASMLFVAVAQFEQVMYLVTGLLIAYSCTVRAQLQQHQASTRAGPRRRWQGAAEKPVERASRQARPRA